MADTYAKSNVLGSLAQWLAGQHDWPLTDRLVLIERLVRQVQTLHQDGRLHRAITAEAVALGDEMRPELSSPGPPRHFGGDDCDPEFCPPELTAGPGVLLPELINSARKALQEAGYSFDPRRIDVYQIGVLLLRVVANEPVTSYIYDATIKNRLPAPVRPLLERSLGLDSPERFDSCEALLAAIEAELRKVKVFQAFPPSQYETPPMGSVILLDNDTPPRGLQAEPAPSKSQQLPFQRLGHFRILAQIGGGGMGDVYRGYDESLDRQVAVKVLPPQLARDADFVRRFHAEATAAASVAHPNVVPIYFSGEDAGFHFFVMQYVDGESLAERLSRQGRLSTDEALKFVSQCLAGLQAAHARGLIHRDVKPGNILIERETGRAMLVDFGLVRRLGENAGMTATGVVMGTVDYIAPEQARGRKVDARADIYSLGVLFYQLLAGRLPFVADSPTAMIFQHAYEAPFPLEQAAPGVPPPVIQIVARMMAKDPLDRYPDCGAVLADIVAYRKGEPLAAAGPASGAVPIFVAGGQKNGTAPFDAPEGSPVSVVPEGMSQFFGQDSAEMGLSLSSPEGLSQFLRQNDAKMGLSVLPPARLPEANRWQGMRDWAATMFRRHAPEFVQEMQGTVQQMDAAVAQYQRRRNQLAKLLQEARSLENELPPEQIEDLQQQLAVAESTLARLRSQQDLLKARWQAAESRRQMEGGQPAQKRRRWLVPAAFGTGLVALSLSLMILSKIVFNGPRPLVHPPITAVKTATRRLAPLPPRAPVQFTERTVTEGVGWGPFRLGATGEELSNALGPPEASTNPGDRRLRWLSQPHVECLMDDVRGALEIRFNEGFNLPLASGVKIGSTASKALSAYGAPSRVVQSQAAQMLEFGDRGVLMWITSGRVTSFTVFKPYATNAGRESSKPIFSTSLRSFAKPLPMTQAYVIADAAYQPAIRQMVAETPLNVHLPSHGNYESFLPLARGQVLLIETHHDRPLVPINVLESYFPNASAGLARPLKWIRVGDTAIVFVEFADQLQVLFQTPESARGNGGSLESYTIGNSPYYQAINQMATEAGLQVGPAFNTSYDTYLPRARGHVLLIESHNCKPIIPPDVLEAHFPGAMRGLTLPSKSVRINDTSILFLDFSEQLHDVGLSEGAWSNQASNKSAINTAAEPKNIQFAIGRKSFRPGDSISITEVKASSPELRAGDQVIVKGHYTLASEAKASLSLFITSAQAFGGSGTHSGHSIVITKGQGEFALSNTLDYPGDLHVSFYPIPGGASFGGVYFGSAKE